MGMMGKLKETQQKIEETKKRLDTITVSEESADKLLSITMTANRELKSLEINDELLQDKEQLEDYLVLHINKAIEQAQLSPDQAVYTVKVPGVGYDLVLPNDEAERLENAEQLEVKKEEYLKS